MSTKSNEEFLYNQRSYYFKDSECEAKVAEAYPSAYSYRSVIYDCADVCNQKCRALADNYKFTFECQDCYRCVEYYRLKKTCLAVIEAPNC